MDELRRDKISIPAAPKKQVPTFFESIQRFVSGEPVPYRGGSVMHIGSAHSFANHPEILSAFRPTGVAFETFFNVLSPYQDERFRLPELLAERVRRDGDQGFSNDLFTNLTRFTKGQYLPLLRNIFQVDPIPSLYGIEAPLTYETNERAEEVFDRERPAIDPLHILWAPVLYGAAEALIGGKNPINRRTALVGIGSLVATLFTYEKLHEKAVKEDKYIGFANRLRELIMSLKIDVIFDALQAQGIEKPRIAIVAGLGHGGIITKLQEFPRQTRTEFVVRYLRILREKYEKVGNDIADEICSGLTVPAVVDIKREYSETNESTYTATKTRYALSDPSFAEVCP